MPVPVWARNHALAILGRRPTADQFAPNPDLTPAERDTLLRWWDSWIEPLARTIAEDDYYGSQLRSRYLGQDKGCGRRRLQELAPTEPKA